ncbi:MAG: response regulator [Candidatus Omnitrophota bacterium]
MSKKKNVLIVDDEPKIRDIFRRSLQPAGYHIINAADGEEALIVFRNEEEIALVILDIGLPKISGIDVFELIRIRSPRVKIIVASIHPYEEQKFLIWNADDYYYKSEHISVLKEKVRTLLKG